MTARVSGRLAESAPKKAVARKARRTTNRRSRRIMVERDEGQVRNVARIYREWWPRGKADNRERAQRVCDWILAVADQAAAAKLDLAG